jgi:hypothetical protein
LVNGRPAACKARPRLRHVAARRRHASVTDRFHGESLF